MSAKHPTPWRVKYWWGPTFRKHFDSIHPIVDADGNDVLSIDDDADEETAIEIVEAVNERAERMAKEGAGNAEA